jgi:hypothetical protein
VHVGDSGESALPPHGMSLGTLWQVCQRMREHCKAVHYTVLQTECSSVKE